jgi:hypothetical protein
MAVIKNDKGEVIPESSLADRFPAEEWARMREQGSFYTLDTVIRYQAANGHRMAYWEDAARPGKPARQCAWESWHSEDCGCGGREPLPDY